jgi:hypothetical protein
MANQRTFVQAAALLKQINPTGVNPLVEPVYHLSAPGPCRDCGRITRNDYLCTPCERDLAERRRVPNDV